MGHRFIRVAILALCMVTANAVAEPREYLKKPADWFKSDEARKIADNVLSFQSDLGGWPKNTDTSSRPYAGADRDQDLAPTFDNGATTDELRLLARIHGATQDDRYKAAFLKGYDYVLASQYENGGFPQRHPARGYSVHITFNDNSMVRLMEFLRESCTSDVYAFLDVGRRGKARAAFDEGIACILRCQIRVDEKLTAWCAQHEKNTLAPAPARTYELVSLSGSESVGIVRLLMSLEKPSPEVIRAVDAAVAWLDRVKITGLRQQLVPDPQSPKGTDKRLVPDPAAPPLWARFYEIGTNRPFFCDRDGVKKYHLHEIGYERRNGYGWLGTWGADLIAKEYPAWKRKHSTTPHIDRF